MDERRKYKRFPEHLSVHFHIITLSQSGEAAHSPDGDGKTGNISEGGLLFECTELIPVGSFLEIKLFLPEQKEPLIVKGKVVRIEEVVYQKKYDVGVSFSQMFQTEKDILLSHIRHWEEG